jgi:NADH-quinone oxidoreductase subunit N
MFEFAIQTAGKVTIPQPDYFIALPEILLLGMICFILLVDVFLSDRTRFITYFLTQATLIGLAVFTVMNFAGDKPVYEFSNSFIRDQLGDVLKISIYIVTVLVFLYSRNYLKNRGIYKGEYFVIGLFGILGMQVMVSSYHFLTLYLGLEILALSLYAMVAFHRKDGIASEAAIKYFVLGAIASGMLLYGISMVYGVTGNLGFAEVSQFAMDKSNDKTVLAFGLVFIIVGIAFKLGAAPFHMWLPDVYHGAPTSVTMYLGSVPKFAAFAMIIRLLVYGLPGGLFQDWQQMLIVMAILSMGVGNIIALAQTNLKRMLAYSTISHVGFLLLGVIAHTKDGYAASLFYTITYALTAAAAFGLIILMHRKGFEADKLEDYKGLNERSPWFAFVILIVMFSLAGVPPTVGFFAKLWVLESIIATKQLTWLAVVAVSFAIIGAFYYIRIIKLMYFDKAETQQRLEASGDMKLVLSLHGLALLGLGVYPTALVALCSSILKAASV